jgi:hypothetical protein
MDDARDATHSAVASSSPRPARELISPELGLGALSPTVARQYLRAAGLARTTRERLPQRNVMSGSAFIVRPRPEIATLGFVDGGVVDTGFTPDH